MNPFHYTPAQIAKAITAALTAVIGLLGLAASVFTTGAWVTVGQWATAAALFLVPVVVFMTKAEPWLEMLDGSKRGEAVE